MDNRKNETFIIGKSNLDSINEKIDEKVTTIKNNKETNQFSTKSIIDLTKSILLGVTCGQFDLKNTKVCSTTYRLVKVNSLKIII